jgi:hypothetical protein
MHLSNILYQLKLSAATANEFFKHITGTKALFAAYSFLPITYLKKQQQLNNKLRHRLA